MGLPDHARRQRPRPSGYRVHSQNPGAEAGACCVDAGGPGEGGILVLVRVRMSSRPRSMPACRTGLADARILIIITALPARPAEE